jgi:type II secretion system protein N
MQVPGIALPSLPGGLLGFFRRPAVLYATYTLVLFLVFIVATFPHEILVQRALDMVQTNSVAVSIDGADFAWWNGWEVQDLRLNALPLKEGAPPLLEFARLQVRPDWGGWLRGQLSSAALWGELYGGTADGRIRYTRGDPASVRAQLEWSGVEIRRYRALTTWLDEGRLTGTLAGWFEAQVNAGAPPEGEGEVLLQRAGLTGGKVMGFTVPDLSVEDAKSKFILKGDRLELQEVALTGGEINLQVAGFVSLREPLGQSIPNLRLTIQKLPESLKPLVAVFAPRAKTLPAQLQITGSLARPQVK